MLSCRRKTVDTCPGVENGVLTRVRDELRLADLLTRSPTGVRSLLTGFPVVFRTGVKLSQRGKTPKNELPLSTSFQKLTLSQNILSKCSSIFYRKQGLHVKYYQCNYGKMEYLFLSVFHVVILHYL